MMRRVGTCMQIAKIGIILSITLCMDKVVIAQTKTEIRVPKVKELENTLICQGRTKNLTCSNETEVLVVYSARYGRDVLGEKICPYDPAIESVDKDDTNTKCMLVDVMEKVQRVCHKQRFCAVSVGEDLLGQRCEGVYKYLKMVYACGVAFYVQISNQSNVTSINTTSLPSNATQTPTITSNASCVTANTTGKPRTTPVPMTTIPFVVVKTEIRRRKPARRSTGFYVTSTTTYQRELQSSAIEYGIAGRLLIWFLHFRGKIAAAPAQTM